MRAEPLWNVPQPTHDVLRVCDGLVQGVKLILVCPVESGPSPELGLARF